MKHEEALLDAFRRLADEGVNAKELAVLLIGPNDMIIGETASTAILVGKLPILVTNPKRLTRHNLVNRNTGELASEIRMGDFDFISEGCIEVEPIGGFFLRWLDLGSQLRYCSAYLGYIVGKRNASAAAAGITLAGPSTLKDLIAGK